MIIAQRCRRANWVKNITRLLYSSGQVFSIVKVPFSDLKEKPVANHLKDTSVGLQNTRHKPYYDNRCGHVFENLKILLLANNQYVFFEILAQ